MNLYAYVGGNPATWIDAKGLSSITSNGATQNNTTSEADECDEDKSNCWLNCMKNYPGIEIAFSLATLGTVGNLKIPGMERKRFSIHIII